MLGFASAFASYRLLFELGAVVLVAAGLYFYGHRQGAAGVQARWDAAEVVRREAEWERERANDKRAGEAALRYEAASAALTAGRGHATAKRVPALLAPIACAGGALGDLRVPAAVLDSLRDVETDRGNPAAGGPGAAVFPGP